MRNTGVPACQMRKKRKRLPFRHFCSISLGMLLSADYKPEFDSLRDALLELATIRHVDELVHRVVTILAGRPHIALARIWQVDQGDLCASCRMAVHCPDRTRCLHLVASAGAPGSDDRPDWSRVDGEFSRIPLGVGKVGRVGASGEAIVVKDFAEDPVVAAALPMGGAPAHQRP